MTPTNVAARRAWGKVEKLNTSSIATAAATETIATIPFDIYRVFLKDDGIFPNNEQYPVLLYKSAFTGTQDEGVCKITMDGHWTPPWVWGIYSYHHYHSKAWELLLCVRGRASVQLGGKSGPTVIVEKGDFVLIPPGIAHKQLNDSGGFTLLGSYPTAQGFDAGSIDTLTGSPTDDERENIASCHVPERDIFGLDIRELCKAAP